MEQQKTVMWIDKGIGFILGILAFLIAALILNIIAKNKKSQSDIK